jgi:hypothetical protein
MYILNLSDHIALHGSDSTSSKGAWDDKYAIIIICLYETLSKTEILNQMKV